MLHETGHAYIEDQNIPVLGKEEDAVDNFATILMIDFLEDGAEMAISAADMFAFESDYRPDYYDFGEYIDEHSFDLQRYFSTLCLVYGSEPDQYKSLLDELKKTTYEIAKTFANTTTRTYARIGTTTCNIMNQKKNRHVEFSKTNLVRRSQ